MSDPKLEEARAAAAEAAYQDEEFELRVETANGWEHTTGEDTWSRTVFMDVGAEDTKAMGFAVTFQPGSADLAGPPSYDEPAWEGPEEETGPVFGYYINLDERGEFYADVRDEAGDSVFDIRTDGDQSVFEDLGMEHKADIRGLRAHLIEMDVLPDEAVLLGMAAFEAEIEKRNTAGSAFTL